MIDWDLIAGFEGGDQLHGYVPDPSGSRSGVTIASGVDIGNMGRLGYLALPPDVQDLVISYLGLTGARAVAALKAKPLTVTQAQANALDAVSHAYILGPLRASYDSYTHKGAFDALPDRAQTVITSLEFQYGGLMPTRCPKFWGMCVRQDWAGAVEVLKNFGDKYPTRRLAEAEYLSVLLPASL